MSQAIYFHERQPFEGNPGGVTVSKTEALPQGDFGITEFFWDDVTLWFIDDHHFTPDEREEARMAVYEHPTLLDIALA